MLAFTLLEIKLATFFIKHCYHSKNYAYLYTN